MQVDTTKSSKVMANFIFCFLHFLSEPVEKI